ncbi:MAG: hypothetical protein GAK35_02635 [Herbaspirillum frisingense]|uniref:Uncharacterized protein n=1 Tax=Herbaspirillum frisingense TaxID=92645 RepID=A0A7V8JTL2_9BURK|nr:MAG: hypothetical protein GAK35_02635 [Herbaspirillum frisingense]
MKKTTHHNVRYGHGTYNADIHVMAYVSKVDGEPDCVNLGITKGGFSLGEGLTPAVARDLAAALLKAADQVDAWLAQPAELEPQ